MRKYRAGLIAATLSAGAMWSGTAKASAIPDFFLTTYLTPGGVQTPVTMYAGTVNTPLTLPIYLYANTQGVSLISNDEGLYSAGFSITQTGGTGIITGVAPSTTSNGGTYGPAGQVNTPAGNSATHVQLSEYSLSYSPSSPVVANADNQIELGSLTVAATAPGTYTFILNSYAAGTPSLDDNLTYESGYDVDLTNDTGNLGGSPMASYTGTSSNPETFTVIVTPEPATLSLVGVAGVGLLLRRRNPLA